MTKSSRPSMVTFNWGKRYSLLFTHRLSLSNEPRNLKRCGPWVSKSVSLDFGLRQLNCLQPRHRTALGTTLTLSFALRFRGNRHSRGQI